MMTAQPSPLTLAATTSVLRLLDGPPSPERLNSALRQLSKWRAQMLEGEVVRRSGEVVLAGPFKGMAYPVRSPEGSRSCRLLGSYEAGLTPVIQAIIAGGYDLILNVGCAEGYYAVGLAMLCPQARVLAHDTDMRAQGLCKALAAANGIEARVQIGGEVGHADLGVCAGQKSVILCDIEGAENALLDPVKAPALLEADILVEVHEAGNAGLADRIAERFAETHKVTLIGRQFSSDSLPGWAEGLSDIDRFLLLWEWRAVPTPWLWMTRR
jgi:hypothetical protein